jgi:hypothetical protein
MRDYSDQIATLLRVEQREAMRKVAERARWRALDRALVAFLRAHQRAQKARKA